MKRNKTAGREGRYAFALDDKNLAIRKRLFTATPRHYNPLRKDKEGDARLVFSMDKPDVYGPRAYGLIRQPRGAASSAITRSSSPSSRPGW
jgi:predicted helicase